MDDELCQAEDCYFEDVIIFKKTAIKYVFN